jgi:hypothetical protein
MEEENKPKRGVGRPRLELTMPTEWEKIIIDAGKEGKHITDFLLTLGISWEGHHSLMKRSKKYSEAVHQYERFCEQWWFEKARISMEESEGAGFNSKLWSLIMRNKFSSRWSEASKVDVTTNGEKIENNSIQIEIIRPNKNSDENPSDPSI